MARATNTTPLARRKPRHAGRFNRLHPAARAFHAPQRERAPKIQHPKAA